MLHRDTSSSFRESEGQVIQQNEEEEEEEIGGIAYVCVI